MVKSISIGLKQWIASQSLARTMLAAKNSDHLMCKGGDYLWLSRILHYWLSSTLSLAWLSPSCCQWFWQLNLDLLKHCQSIQDQKQPNFKAPAFRIVQFTLWQAVNLVNSVLVSVLDVLRVNLIILASYKRLQVLYCWDYTRVNIEVSIARDAIAI